MLPCGDSEDVVFVPTIHALLVPQISALSPQRSPPDISDARSRLVSHLASAFQPADPAAAELLLLNLISSPIGRQAGQDALGTLSIDFVSDSSTDVSAIIIRVIQGLMPMVVTLPLSVSLLHSTSFVPISADSTSLDAGLLQLCNGTVLAIQEGEMGEGGQLDEKATSNLKDLIECLRSQTLRYAYPFMPSLRMDCSIRGIVFSEAKSMVPVSGRKDKLTKLGGCRNSNFVERSRTSDNRRRLGRVSAVSGRSGEAVVTSGDTRQYRAQHTGRFCFEQARARAAQR
jgi:hypothetical protein